MKALEPCRIGRDKAEQKVGVAGEIFGAGSTNPAIPFDCAPARTATRFDAGGPTVRFSVGLEDLEDLQADLDRGFARLTATA